MIDQYHPEGPSEQAEVLQYSPVDNADTLSPDIDLQALAKEIYTLLKEELRRERERQGKP